MSTTDFSLAPATAEGGDMPPTTNMQLTADAELLCCLGPTFPPLADTDPARIAALTREFAAGFSILSDVVKAVSVFGSARARPQDRDYELAVEIGRRLGQAGFAVITGGGPWNHGGRQPGC